MKYSHKYLFRIEMEGVEVAQFESCSDLGVEVADVERWEGGSIIGHYEPGRATFDDLTLTSGKTDSLELHNLFLKTLDPNIGIQGVGQVGAGENDTEFSFDLIELNRDQSEKARTRVWCWYTKRYVHTQTDNNADETVIQQVVLKVKSFKPIN